MRRLLSELRDYLSELASATRRGWNAFFFTPADPTAAGPDPDRRGLAGLLEPAGLRARPARLLRLARLG